MTQSPTELLSPKQVARAIGVSESSLKRWCDQGLIHTVRTVGGHRKMRVSEVLRFVRERDQPLVSPEVLGLPPNTEGASRGLTRGQPQLVEALICGDEALSRQIIFDLYLAKHSLSVLFDDLITGAFREIGDRWACHNIDIYHERRSCECVLRILMEMRKLQPQPDRSMSAIGGTIEGDFYSLPFTMAELVLRECGFHTTSLGTSLPFASLVRAVKENRPNLFWLSVSHIRDDIDFVAGFGELSKVCSESGTALVVGGRSLHETLRQQLRYSAYCDTMRHLESFAETLARSLRQSNKGRAKKKSASKAADAKEKSPRRS